MPVGPYKTFSACVRAMRGRGHSPVAARRICGKMEKDSKKKRKRRR